MTKSSQYLSENAQWIADKSQVDRIAALSDAEFDAVLAASGLIGQGDEDPASIMFTAETLEDWLSSRATWRERGAVRQVTCAGFPGLHFESFQMRKGQARIANLAVVDLGNRRVVIG